MTKSNSLGMETLKRVPSQIFLNKNNFQTNQVEQITTLVELLRYRAGYQPNQTAFIWLEDGETESDLLTYGELDSKARAIAAYLQSHCTSGDRVLLVYPPSLDFIAAFFGCLYAGVVAVPVNPPQGKQKIPRLQKIVSDAQTKIALTTTALLDDLERRFNKTQELTGCRWLPTDNIDLIGASDWQEPTINEETLAFLQYTSGSTGQPKGVMVNHYNILHNCELIKEFFQDTPDTIGVSWLPHYHDMGLIGGILQPLYLGVQMVLMSPFDFQKKPIRWLQAISRYKATTSGGPNFAYDLCANKIQPFELENLDLSSWKLAFTGAEPVRAEMIEGFTHKFKSCGFQPEAFYPCYGMAETTLIVSGGLKTETPVICQVDAAALEKNQVVLSTVADKTHRKLVGLGQPQLDHKIRIVDPASSSKCSEGKVGEIWVSGSSVAQGYWNQPQQTKETFHNYIADTGEGPFLRTGDLGFLQDGKLFVTGRLKDLIIIRGRNHYPQDLELTVQKSHPFLDSVAGAAFSVELEGIEKLVIVQEVERSCWRKLNANEVTEAIRQAITQEHDLQVYAIVLLKPGSIPKTSSGKIQRHACREKFLEGTLNVVAEWSINPKGTNKFRILDKEIECLTQTLRNWQSVAKQPEQKPQDLSTKPETLETWMISQLAQRSKLEPQHIDLEKPFSDYGLDSLESMNLLGELETFLGYRLNPSLIWECSTVKALTQHLCKTSPENTLLSENLPSEKAIELLDKLDQLSEYEIDSLLQSLLSEKQGNQIYEQLSC